MFEQSLIENQAHGVRPWTIAASVLIQAVVVGATILAPLFFTYNPPMDWVRNALLLAPPPPPAPPPPASAPAPKATDAVRFEDTLTAPAVIPDNTALFRDASGDSIEAPQLPDLNGVRGGVTGGVLNGVLGAALTPPERPIPVGGNVQAAKVISRVNPVYPPEAIAVGLSGIVYLQAIITKDGVIRQIQVLNGDPTLAASALEAVRQWRYRPTILNGNPVEVITQIEVKFQLAAAPTPVAGANKKGKKTKNR